MSSHPTGKRIRATFKLDHLEWRRRKDVTDEILAMDVGAIHALKDADYSTDHLMGAGVIAEARKVWNEHYGDNSHLRFGYYIAVVDEIREFFDVRDLEEITELHLEAARMGEDPTQIDQETLKKLLQSDRPEIRQQAIRTLKHQPSPPSSPRR